MDLKNPKWERKWSRDDLYEAGLILNFALAEMPGYWEAYAKSKFASDDSGEVVANWFAEYGRELLNRAPIKMVPTRLLGLAEDIGLLPEITIPDARTRSLKLASVWPYPIYAKLGSHYRLLDGNHRRALMEGAGHETMPAVLLPMDTVFEAIKSYLRDGD